jgi:hypothetical protein
MSEVDERCRVKSGYRDINSSGGNAELFAGTSKVIYKKTGQLLTRKEQYKQFAYGCRKSDECQPQTNGKDSKFWPREVDKYFGVDAYGDVIRVVHIDLDSLLDS